MATEGLPAHNTKLSLISYVARETPAQQPLQKQRDSDKTTYTYHGQKATITMVLKHKETSDNSSLNTVDSSDSLARLKSPLQPETKDSLTIWKEEDPSLPVFEVIGSPPTIEVFVSLPTNDEPETKDPPSFASQNKRRLKANEQLSQTSIGSSPTKACRSRTTRENRETSPVIIDIWLQSPTSESKEPTSKDWMSSTKAASGFNENESSRPADKADEPSSTFEMSSTQGKPSIVNVIVSAPPTTKQNRTPQSNVKSPQSVMTRKSPLIVKPKFEEVRKSLTAKKRKSLCTVKANTRASIDAGRSVAQTRIPRRQIIGGSEMNGSGKSPRPLSQTPPPTVRGSKMNGSRRSPRLQSQIPSLSRGLSVKTSPRQSKLRAKDSVLTDTKSSERLLFQSNSPSTFVFKSTVIIPTKPRTPIPHTGCSRMTCTGRSPGTPVIPARSKIMSAESKSHPPETPQTICGANSSPMKAALKSPRQSLPAQARKSPPTAQARSTPPTAQARSSPPTAQARSSPPPTTQPRSSPPATAQVRSSPPATAQVRSSPPTAQARSSPPPTAQPRSSPPATAQVRSSPPATAQVRSSPPTAQVRSSPPTAQARSSPPTAQARSSPPPTAQPRSSPPPTAQARSSPESMSIRVWRSPYPIFSKRKHCHQPYPPAKFHHQSMKQKRRNKKH